MKMASWHEGQFDPATRGPDPFSVHLRLLQISTHARTTYNSSFVSRSCKNLWLMYAATRPTRTLPSPSKKCFSTKSTSTVPFAAAQPIVSGVLLLTKRGLCDVGL
jgi:hypothetical protein